MEEDIYVLDMPDFQPIYSKEEEYGYRGKKALG